MAERRDRLAGAKRFGWLVHLDQGARAIAGDDFPAQVHFADVDFFARAHVGQFDRHQRAVDLDDLTHSQPHRIEASAARR